MDLSENESKNIKLNIKHILLSIMICYDFSFEKELFNKEYSIFINILEINYRNLILIYEYIIEKINSENKSNQLVQQLEQLVNNFNKKENINNIYKNIRQLSLMEKMTYNITMLKEKIRDLLKNYKSKGISYLTNIFKKINGKNFEEINSIYVDNILRVENINGPVLASVFLKENKCFRTEPAPYIKTKNIKKFSLILDLDEILFHFKIDNNNENDYEGVLQIRPMVIPFLERVGTYYELIIFTSTQNHFLFYLDPFRFIALILPQPRICRNCHFAIFTASEKSSRCGPVLFSACGEHSPVEAQGRGYSKKNLP